MVKSLQVVILTMRVVVSERIAVEFTRAMRWHFSKWNENNTIALRSIQTIKMTFKVWIIKSIFLFLEWDSQAPKKFSIITNSLITKCFFRQYGAIFNFQFQPKVNLFELKIDIFLIEREIFHKFGFYVKEWDLWFNNFLTRLEKIFLLNPFAMVASTK